MASHIHSHHPLRQQKIQKAAMMQVADLSLHEPVQYDSSIISKITAAAFSDAEAHQMLQNERLRILRVTNYLEALHARLLALRADGPVISAVTREANALALPTTPCVHSNPKS